MFTQTEIQLLNLNQLNYLSSGTMAALDTSCDPQVRVVDAYQEAPLVAAHCVKCQSQCHPGERTHVETGVRKFSQHKLSVRKTSCQSASGRP